MNPLKMVTWVGTWTHTRRQSSESKIDESVLHPLVRKHHPIRALPQGRSLVVRMDITNKCNLDCIHCTLAMNRDLMGETVSDMTVDLFTKIAEQVFPYAKIVALSCEAEPTMHARFQEILRIVKEAPGPAYMMTTNATTLTERSIQAIFDCGMHGISISVDGANAETFRRIRKRGKFEKLLRSIEHVNRIKASMNRGRDDLPRLHVNYTLMRSTIEELPTMVELCRDWGVHRLTLQHLYAVEQTGLRDESLVNARERSDSILRRCKEACDSYGILTTFPALFFPDLPIQVTESPGIETLNRFEAAAQTETEPRLFCYAPWQMLRIRWNGAVHPCDPWQGPPIGDLQTSSFDEIWTSPPYVRLRWDHARRVPTHQNCVGCSMVTTDNLEGKFKSTPLVLTPGAQRD